MKFTVSGSLRIGKKNEIFKKQIEAKDETCARELVYSLFGSEHGTKRRWISIEKIEKGG